MTSIVERLEATRDETIAFFMLGDAELARTYGPGKWSVRFILHHLADAETVEFERIRRVLSERRVVVWSFDQDAWAKALDYQSLPLTLSRDIYRAVRTGVLHYARLHSEHNGHLEFVHSEKGRMTLEHEFEKVASHNERHLAQIRQALAQ